jgi:hypothetical protein
VRDHQVGKIAKPLPPFFNERIGRLAAEKEIRFFEATLDLGDALVEGIEIGRQTPVVRPSETRFLSPEAYSFTIVS